MTALVDGGGTIQAQYYYDPFGTVLEGDVNYRNPYLYSGYFYDAESGLYDLKARFYDPKIARFLQEDTYRGERAAPPEPQPLHLLYQ